MFDQFLHEGRTGMAVVVFNPTDPLQCLSIESEALIKMQALSTKYAMGISIDQVQLKYINPPEPVQASFNLNPAVWDRAEGRSG